MISKNKKIILFQRLIIWLFYLFSGFILYFQKGNLESHLIGFTRVVYPLSIFWLQIRIKKRENFLQIDSEMTTSQLWFNILPVLASFFGIIFTVTNSLIFILDTLINN